MSPTGKLANGGKRQVGLEHKVRMVEMGLWPTPTVSGNHNKSGMSEKSGDGLSTAVKRSLWPTPKASPSGPDYARVNRENAGGDDLVTAVARTQSGALNPAWVEWLMGYPIGWTDLGD